MQCKKQSKTSTSQQAVVEKYPSYLSPPLHLNKIHSLQRKSHHSHAGCTHLYGREEKNAEPETKHGQHLLEKNPRVSILGGLRWAHLPILIDKLQWLLRIPWTSIINSWKKSFRNRFSVDFNAWGLNHDLHHKPAPLRRLERFDLSTTASWMKL